MLGVLWMRGLLGRRRGRLLATAAGIAMAVALLASIGAFLGSSAATMTRRTAANVPVDWQVETQPGADPAAVLAAVRATPSVTVALPVGMAATTGLSAQTGDTTQTTGAGVVVGIPDGYSARFGGMIRPLVGAATGVLVAQQTAANLHVRPGDTVSVGRAGSPPASLTVDGVVDLPHADSLFQRVGAAPGSQPSAPPDNVLMVPLDGWHRLFDPVAAARPDQVRQQVHVHLDRALPPAPGDAFDHVTGLARNLESRLAGAGLVGDNLGAALDAARGDAAYATVLFLFLGLPGAVLAGLLTAVVAGTGADRRRHDQALLRARGAGTRTLVGLALLEALAAGAAGGAGGLLLAALTGRLAFGDAGFGEGAATVLWDGLAVATGLLIAALVVAVPAIRDARRLSVAGARRIEGRRVRPVRLPATCGAVLLGVAVATYAVTSRQGYTLVLAPEGVPSISVDHLALAGPASLWVATALITWSLAELGLRRGRRLLTRAVRPVAGPLASTVSASLSRQRRLLGPGLVLVGLTAAFAASTSVFNATYAQQAEVDARLTNGADVTVTEPPGAPATGGTEARLAALPGVRAVEPLVHRFAYVGADLQDLYGVRPGTITAAASLQDAYFQGGTAAQLMARLAARPDAILVSAETVRDFQLQPGDRLTLRLQDRRSQTLTPVTFHYAGVASEFPTAPRDSFLVANAAYVGAMTGDPSPSTYLVDTGGTPPAGVAEAARRTLGVGPVITDIATARRVVGSSLTAVDLDGLTRVELGFALVFGAASTGLLLALGVVERRRTFALAAALGAKRRQLAAFLWAEAGVVVAGGLAAGALAGWALSRMLVAVLSGVFDPPPAALRVPAAYLGSAAAVAVLAVVAVVMLFSRRLTRVTGAMLREL
ncbi:MAG TPA: FtsX-like permease family protein [Candidatus Dormibacteraeota bacterium]|nr:FtsX-like permease family protein [Candidatus Dormibacteraeota bacterium]